MAAAIAGQVSVQDFRSNKPVQSLEITATGLPSPDAAESPNNKQRPRTHCRRRRNGSRWIFTKLAFGGHNGRAGFASGVVAVTGDLYLVARIVAIIAAIFFAGLDQAVTSGMSAFLLLSGHVGPLPRV
jgi:hypothetical protein